MGRTIGRRIDLKAFGLGTCLVVLIGWVTHAWLGVAFWKAAAIVLAAMLVNGVVAVVEDEAPGGLNNPGDD